MEYRSRKIYEKEYILSAEEVGRALEAYIQEHTNHLISDEIIVRFNDDTTTSLIVRNFDKEEDCHDV